MNLRNQETYIASLWDWTFLNGCFDGTNIRVTDIDGLVERNGHFLFIETKAPRQDAPIGQSILFDRLVANPMNHVLLIWGLPGHPQCARFWGHNLFEADEEKIKEVVSRWFKYADTTYDP